MAKVFIGLGSNLDDPRDQLIRAFSELHAIPKTQLTAVSKLYQSKAVGPEQPDYINAVAQLETELAPLDLLDQLQAIEQAHQRVRKEHWGPRTLDLDLLLFNNDTIEHLRLIVPHAYLSQRNFVLIPLADIEPELRLPSGAKISELIETLGRDGLAAIESLELKQLLEPTSTPVSLIKERA